MRGFSAHVGLQQSPDESLIGNHVSFGERMAQDSVE
jgi:hypothetical protein